MPGRPFLQIPGPTLVPDRIVRAMAQPIIDHRGPKFAALVEECVAGVEMMLKEFGVPIHSGQGSPPPRSFWSVLSRGSRCR